MVTTDWRLCYCAVKQMNQTGSLLLSSQIIMGWPSADTDHHHRFASSTQLVISCTESLQVQHCQEIAVKKCLPSLLTSIQIEGIVPCYHSCQVCRGLGAAGACEFGLPLISGRDVSSQKGLIKKKEVDWLVSSQREYGPALCNATAHTRALLQQLRRAVSLRRLQQSCYSCTLFTHHPPPTTYFLFFRNFASASTEMDMMKQCLHPKLK